jgi:Mrp family chromosome partitioning ATPase
MLLERSGAKARQDATEHTPASNGEHPAPNGEIIMITSGGSGDGKTTTVANLAAAYGESGRSVLVLSFDFRRLRGRNRAKLSRAAGVTEYLVADPPIPLETLMVDTKVRGVSMVGIGNASRPPGGQFDAQRRLLDEARTLADVVLIDSAPLLASSINRELTTMIDGVVALCRVGRTTIGEAERCGDLLEQLGARAVGVVMIGVSAPEGSEYFAYFTRRRDVRAQVEQAAPVAEPEPDDVTAAGSAPTGNGEVRQGTLRDVPADER